MKRIVHAILLGICLLLAAPAFSSAAQSITIGSKSFTENVILGDIVTGLLNSAEGSNAVHRSEIGGTRILWEALLSGEIDVYPEYTGTIVEEILAGQDANSASMIADALADYGIHVTEPLGFNNTYVLGVRPETAAEFNLKSISDLRDHPNLTFGFSNEFMARGDGWPALRDAYGLAPDEARGIDHDLGYRALENGSIDVIDLYSTDAEIDFYGLTLLEDDLSHFPEYQAVLLYRNDVSVEAVALLRRLESRISEQAMIAMNAAAKIDHESSTEIARAFLLEMGVQTAHVAADTWRTRLARNTVEHLFLVLISLVAAILVAITWDRSGACDNGSLPV
jgi:osmoprotectant transport system permease protein